MSMSLQTELRLAAEDLHVMQPSSELVKVLSRAADELDRAYEVIRRANEQAEKFERQWYLEKGEVEDLRAELEALKRQEPIGVEAVCVVAEGLDGKRIDWLIEGGLGDLPEGTTLIFAHQAITGADGWGEVFLAAPQPERAAQDTDHDPGPKPGDLLAWGSQAVLDVAAERRRQIEVKGWTPEHDDDHSNGEMSLAAAAYAVSSVERGDSLQRAAALFHLTGWAKYWFKPSSPRRDLVKAGALILAEIERMDRAERSAGDEREGL